MFTEEVFVEAQVEEEDEKDIDCDEDTGEKPVVRMPCRAILVSFYRCIGVVLHLVLKMWINGDLTFEEGELETSFGAF